MKTQAEIKPAETETVLDLLDELDPGDYGEYLNDYRDSNIYICDVISEIADNHTSIYYSDILDFIRQNPEALAEVVDEGLYVVQPGITYSLYAHAQAAECMLIQRDIYENLADSVMMAAVNFIRYDLDMEEIPAELADMLRGWARDTDNSDCMDDIPDKIREYFTE